MKWRVRVRVIDSDLATVLDNEASGPDSGPVADPAAPQLLTLTTTEELEDGWPAPESLWSGTVTYAMASATQAADLASGMIVFIDVFLPSTAVVASISLVAVAGDPQITPADDGVRVTVPLADLRSLLTQTVGTVARPAEDAEQRINAWFAEAGLLSPMPGGSPVWPALAARDPSPTTLGEAVASTLAYCVERGSQGWFLYELGATFLGPTVARYAGVQTNGQGTLPDLAAPLLGPLVLEAGTWTFQPTTAPADRSQVIEADEIAQDGTWRRSVAVATNRVDVVMADKTTVVSTVYAAGERPLPVRYDTDLTDTLDAQALGYVMLPGDRDAGEAWEVDSFRVVLNECPDGWVPGDLRAPAAVVGIDPVWHPEARTWWGGVVVGRVLTFDQGQAWADLALSGRPMTAAEGAVEWDELPAGVTWDTIDPSITWAHLAYITP